MAGKRVQFSQYDTVTMYRSPSSSPQSTPSQIFIPTEQVTSTPHLSVDRRNLTPRIVPVPPPQSIPSSSLSPELPFPLQSRGRPSPPSGMFGVMDPSLRVHKVLRHGLTPPINYNLRLSDESLIETCQELTPSILSEAASIPPVSRIVVTCERSPWSITITPKAKTRNSFVTVADVLRKLYRDLRQGLEMTDQRYGRLSYETQEMLTNAFHARCELLPTGAEQNKEREKGFKRIDYLGTNTRFLGFLHVGEDNEGVHWKLEVCPFFLSSSSTESASDTSW